MTGPALLAARSIASNRTAQALAALLALVLVFGVQECRVRKAQRATGQQALAADTMQATHDTSRVVSLSPKDSARILGDSLRAVQRMVVQVVQKNDALDNAMRLQRVAMQQLTLAVQALNAHASSSAPVTESAEGARVAHYDVRQAPYTVRIDDTLPKPPGRGRVAVGVALDTASVGVRIGCARANPAGIRSAEATVTGPPWLGLRLGRVEQDPSVCQSPALAAPGKPSWWRGLIPRPSVGYGVARVRDSDGTTNWRDGWTGSISWDLLKLAGIP